MRLNAAQIAIIRAGGFGSCYVVAVAKPGETKATAAYKWNTSGRDVAYDGITYPPHGAPIGIDYPQSAPELNHE